MFTKTANEYFAHATSEDSLRKILDSGFIYSARHLADKNPDTEVDVEAYPVIPLRKKMKAGDAVTFMGKTKNPDKIFLTKDSYHPKYGDAVIVKKLISPKKHDRRTTIPNEYTTRRPLSVRNNARVYLDNSKIPTYKEKYKGIRFMPKSELELKEISLWDRLAKLFNKEANEKPSKSFIRKNVSGKGMLVGSEALNIAAPGYSDIDIFIPYKSQEHFNKAIERLKAKHPGLKTRDSSASKLDKRVLTGNLGDMPVDITVAYGPKAEKFQKAFSDAADNLTDEERERIIKTKARLKNSWFFPETRYKRFKRNLDEDLGLSQVYF